MTEYKFSGTVNYFTTGDGSAGTFREEQASGSTYLYHNGNLKVTLSNNNLAADLAQSYGETKSLSDQMPGAALSKLSISGLYVKVSGVNQAFNGSGFNSSSTNFGLDGVSTTQIRIWDKSCAGY